MTLGRTCLVLVPVFLYQTVRGSFVAHRLALASAPGRPVVEITLGSAPSVRVVAVR